MANSINHARVIRYRQLALRETDRSKAAILNAVADEAERGVLVTSVRSHSTITLAAELPQTEIPASPRLYRTDCPSGALRLTPQRQVRPLA